MSPAELISRKGFRTVIRLNLEGTWNMTHTVAAKAFMRAGGDGLPRGGRVVSVTLTPHTGLTLMAHSSAARAGVENLMKVLAVEWTLFFDEIDLDRDRIIGGEGAGLAVVFDALNPERIGVGAGMTGTARLALEKATAYAKEREVWGVPIGAHQGIAHPLAKAKIELELARLMTQKAAVLFDAGSPDAGETSNMAKFAAAEAANHAVDAAIQTHGGNGLALEYGVSDLWWFTRLMRIAPVSEQMVLNHTAQHVLGLPRSY